MNSKLKRPNETQRHRDTTKRRDESAYTVDLHTGASALIEGVAVRFVDGILFDDGRLYAMQIFLNQIARIDLSPVGSGANDHSEPARRIPTAVAKHGDRLAGVNSKIATGFPPTAATYEVVIVNIR